MIWIDNIKGGNVIDDDGNHIGRIINLHMKTSLYGNRTETLMTLEMLISDVRDAQDLWSSKENGG